MSLTEKGSDFNSLEKEIFKSCCRLGCELLKKTLESYDTELCKTRDRKIYRHKGKRKTVLKTVMGETEYERTIYEYITEDGIKSHIYLLDEAMGLETVGFVSGMLAERIAEASCDMSYRRAAITVSEMTGQSISHMEAWRVVQALGEKVDEKEHQSAALAKRDKGTGDLITKLLFEEQDGIYLNLQGKSRKKHGKSYEMKLAIAYDGAIKTGKKRYELTNKVACANFEGIDKFIDRKEGIIADYYNIDEIEMRILNGDGANWIKRSITDDTVHYQLDPFHRNKAVFELVSNLKMRKEIFTLLYSKEIDKLLVYIEALTNSVEDEKEKDNLCSLLTYFQNNKQGLISYKRRGIALPEPKEGTLYRTCGAMESNVFTIIGNRMKGRRANWSINGGNNLARLLCLKTTKKLSKTLQNLSENYLNQKYAEEIITNLSSSKIPLSVGKGYNGFAKANIPSSMKWMKDLLSFKPFTEIKM